MPDQVLNNMPKLSPPAGTPEQAETYLQQLIQLLKSNKIEVFHTDLQKFNLESIQDHYRIDLGDYEVEISHSKQVDTGKDFYIMLFNNVKKIQNNEGVCTKKIILSYTHLSVDQFKNFKAAAEEWLENKRKEEEAKRFKEVMRPINQVLKDLSEKPREELSKETSTQSEQTKLTENQEPSNAEQVQTQSPQNQTPSYIPDAYPPYPQNPNS